MADPGTASVPMTAEERARRFFNHYDSSLDMKSDAINDLAGSIRAAEQEAAEQARSEADVKWANELGKLLADGEQEAEQRGAERQLFMLLADLETAGLYGAAAHLKRCTRARAKQQESTDV